jgi:hypothetical protein
MLQHLQVSNFRGSETAATVKGIYQRFRVEAGASAPVSGPPGPNNIEKTAKTCTRGESLVVSKRGDTVKPRIAARLPSNSRSDDKTMKRIATSVLVYKITILHFYAGFEPFMLEPQGTCDRKNML